MKQEMNKFRVLLGIAVAIVALGAAQAEPVTINVPAEDAFNEKLYKQKSALDKQAGISDSSPGYQYTWTVTLTDIDDFGSLPYLTAYLVNKAEERANTTGYYVYTSAVIDDSNRDNIATSSDDRSLTLTTVFKISEKITYNDSNLATMLIATDGAGGKELGRQLLDTHYSDTTSHTTLGASATYNVPEPTSGLLMLLGMAGLALKRKRA